MVFWWWDAPSAVTIFLQICLNALIDPASESERHLLLDGILQWGNMGLLLLQQLFGGARVILIKYNLEKLVLDSSAANDTEFARRPRTVIQFSRLVEMNNYLLINSFSYAHSHSLCKNSSLDTHYIDNVKRVKIAPF